MLFNTFFCGGNVLLTPTIEKMTFLSSDIKFNYFIIVFVYF